MSEPNPAWMDVLDQIDQSLRQSLGRITDPAPPAEKLGEPVSLGRLDERLEYWQAYLDRAEENAAKAEELLAAEQAAVAECRDGLAQLRETLADWVTRAPGAGPAPASAGASAPSPPAT
jgi:hypothetical protein